MQEYALENMQRQPQTGSRVEIQNYANMKFIAKYAAVCTPTFLLKGQASPLRQPCHDSLFLFP